MVGRFFELPGIAARQNARTRGSALGIGSVRVLKEDPLFGQAIESGRTHPFAAVGAHMHVGRIVHDAEEDVGTRVTVCVQRDTSQR